MKCFPQRLTAILVCVAMHFSAHAQIDSLNLPQDSVAENLKRPQVEMGTGMLFFYGDVGNQHGGSYNPLPANFGVNVSLQAPVAKGLNIRLGALFGTLSGNERSLARNTNFKSNLTMGSIMLEYDFGHWINPNSHIHPYLRTGISAFEFSSKTDLYDGQGRRYYYWQDGSIRNLPEGSQIAGDAVELTRDYSYETDLRELDQDGEGSYELFSLAVPLGAGATIKLNDQLNFRVGADYQFSFTDNIDNISDAGKGVRNGNSQNDRFLYASFGIAYNLKMPGKEEPVKMPQGKNLLVVSDMADQDDDGAADIIDLCPFTPGDATVDEYGCPVDSDHDGVPDIRDEEPASEAGAVVNANGVTMTNQDLRNLYLAYIDSTGELFYEKDMVVTGDIERVKIRNKRSKSYRIMIGSGQEVSAEKITSILSIPDVETMKDSTGSTTYLVGHYSNMEEALLRKIKLENQSVLGVVVLDKFGDIQKVGSDAGKLEEQLRENYTMKEGQMLSNITFRVQIGAYRETPSEGTFKEVPNLLVLKGKDGITRYVSGSFKTIERAAKRKINLLVEGFDGAFITAYKGGKRISLKKAGATLSGEEDFVPQKEPQSAEGVNAYAIQLGAYSGTVPAETLRKFIELGNVKPVRGNDGLTHYIMGDFPSKSKAQSQLKTVKRQGYPSAIMVGLQEDKVIPLK